MEKVIVLETYENQTVALNVDHIICFRSYRNKEKGIVNGVEFVTINGNYITPLAFMAISETLKQYGLIKEEMTIRNR